MIFIRKKSKELFLISLLLLLCIYFYSDTITLFPSYIHAWTQSDRLALALGFVENGLNFFKPQTFNLATTEGITGVDFPINEYIIALFFTLTGSEHPIFFRLYILIYALVGYLFLFRLSQLFTSQTIKSFVVVIFAFTCPILTYYQAGFLPSVTAFANVFIGYYFYFYDLKNKNATSKFQHQQTKIRYPFILAVAFLTLAALMRTPFNIFLFAILLQQIKHWFDQKQINWKQLGIYTIAYLVIIGYQGYKAYLNHTYGTQFLTFLLPAENGTGFMQIIQTVYEVWRYQLFTTYHYILLFISSFSLGIYFRHHYKNKTLPNQLLSQACLQMVLIIAGACCYFLLMAQQFSHHEYYFIDSFYVGWIWLFLIGLASIPMKKKAPQLIWGILFGLLLLGGVYESKAIQKRKYAETTWDKCELTRKNFKGSAAYLDQLGVPKAAKMLVIDAYSTNLPLLLMKRKGYTVLHTKRENILQALTWDFDYIVIQDAFLPSEVYLPYPELSQQLQRIGGNGRISVFKIAAKPNLTAGNLPTLLGIRPPFNTHFNRFDSLSTPTWSNKTKRTTQHYYSSPSSGVLTAEMAFGPTVRTRLANHSVKKVLFEGQLFTKENSSFHLVLSLHHQEEQVFYQDYPLSLPANERWQEQAYLFVLPETILPETILKCYIWNPNKNHFYVDDLRITIY